VTNNATPLSAARPSVQRGTRIQPDFNFRFNVFVVEFVEFVVFVVFVVEFGASVAFVCFVDDEAFCCSLSLIFFFFFNWRDGCAPSSRTRDLLRAVHGVCTLHSARHRVARFLLKNFFGGSPPMLQSALHRQ
jgi:hypothetical protein